MAAGLLLQHFEPHRLYGLRRGFTGSAYFELGKRALGKIKLGRHQRGSRFSNRCWTFSSAGYHTLLLRSKVLIAGAANSLLGNKRDRFRV